MGFRTSQKELKRLKGFKRFKNGLSTFLEIVIVFFLAAKACGKQYCLRRTKDDELYCVGKKKNNNPKMFCSLDFSLVTLFVSRQRK
jgi:hypothetical protein